MFEPTNFIGPENVNICSNAYIENGEHPSTLHPYSYAFIRNDVNIFLSVESDCCLDVSHCAGPGLPAKHALALSAIHASLARLKPVCFV
jgi:hypothetical protein